LKFETGKILCNTHLLMAAAAAMWLLEGDTMLSVEINCVKKDVVNVLEILTMKIE
jgi:hypothetical protein